jgi:hypothetical protein
MSAQACNVGLTWDVASPPVSMRFSLSMDYRKTAGLSEHAALEIPDRYMCLTCLHDERRIGCIRLILVGRGAWQAARSAHWNAHFIRTRSLTTALPHCIRHGHAPNQKGFIHFDEE